MVPELDLGPELLGLAAEGSPVSILPTQVFSDRAVDRLRHDTSQTSQPP